MWKKLFLLIFLLTAIGCGLIGKNTVTVNDQGAKVEVERSKVTFGQWLEIPDKEKESYVNYYRRHHSLKVDDKTSEIVDFLKSVSKDCEDCSGKLMPEILSSLDKASVLK
jgi:hypothetical protein